MVTVRALIIFGAFLAQYEDNHTGQTANPAVEMMGSLLVTILIPVGLGMFVGIGLFLFGTSRMIYSLFEKEGSKRNTAIFERVMAALIIMAMMAVAVPNLIFSYGEAKRARQIKRTSTANKRSIAVLPLKPLYSTDRDEVYEVGIADSLIQQLSSTKGLVVRPLSGLRKYTAIDQDPLAAGREQKVDYVLASNYQLSDGRIRISAQLINVSSGEVEETYNSEKEIVNLFSLQNAVANDIGNRLLARFGSDPGIFKTKRGTENPEAYRLYMMAMNLSEERGVQNLQNALGYLQRAVDMDPNYALAWAGKAHLHRDIVGHGDPDAKGHYEKSMEAITKALAIDPNLSDAYSALCQNKNRYEYDPVGAETACKRALELDPDSPQAHKTYANFLYSRGRFDEAISHIRTAMDLQPVSYKNQQIYGLTLYYARRFDEAEAQFKRLLELNPNHNYINAQLVLILEAQGKGSEAFEYFIKSLAGKKADQGTIERFKAVYARSGWPGVTLERINKEASEMGSFQLACLYSSVGDKDRAFEYLDKAYLERNFMIPMIQVAPQLAPLRDDPRYTALVRRIEGR
ncbi:MAG: tetratricopeptide repeat protein [Pyrinomonadaceae bacterium]